MKSLHNTPLRTVALLAPFHRWERRHTTRFKAKTGHEFWMPGVGRPGSDRFARIVSMPEAQLPALAASGSSSAFWQAPVHMVRAVNEDTRVGAGGSDFSSCGGRHAAVPLPPSCFLPSLSPSPSTPLCHAGFSPFSSLLQGLLQLLSSPHLLFLPVAHLPTSQLCFPPLCFSKSHVCHF